jgi:hypothetical protein
MLKYDIVTTMIPCRNCGKKFPTSLRIKGRHCILSNRKYCLVCSPYKKPHLYFEARNSKYGIPYTRGCPICHHKFTTDRNQNMCGACRTKIRRHRAKLAAVKFMGGRCVKCGWSENIVALQFHHVRGRKKFEIGMVGNKSWEVIKKELKKCILLCNNCHSIVHSNRNKEFLRWVDRYKGRLLNW